MLEERVKDSKQDAKPFQSGEDFYGKTDYWLRFGILLKIFTFLFVILYPPYRLILGILRFLMPLIKLNTAI